MQLDIQNTDAISFLDKQPRESVNCFLTSPPFDQIRKYRGFNFDFEPIAQRMVKALSQGGTILWNVADQTRQQNQSGSSFRQALYFQSLGLKLNETLIVRKNAFPWPAKWTHYNCFEYLFVFSKGRPAIFRPIHDRKNKRWGKKARASLRRGEDETLIGTDKVFTIGQFGRRGNVWDIEVGGGKQGAPGVKFPAVMNLGLAVDCLRTWTDEDSCVADVCLGSGTTLTAAAMLQRRKGIGCEISPDYCNLARERVAAALNPKKGAHLRPIIPDSAEMIKTQQI